MKTFRFTVPELPLSSFEKKEAEAYQKIRAEGKSNTYWGHHAVHQKLFFKGRNCVERFALRMANQSLIHYRYYRYFYLVPGVIFLLINILGNTQPYGYVLPFILIIGGYFTILIQELGKVIMELERKLAEKEKESPSVQDKDGEGA